MGTQIFESWPNLCLWQLFKESHRQGILADYECPFSNPHNLVLDFLDIFSAQNDFLVSGYLMGTEIILFWLYLCLGGCGCSNIVHVKEDFAFFRGERGLLFVDFTLVCCQPNKM